MEISPFSRYFTQKITCKIAYFDDKWALLLYYVYILNLPSSGKKDEQKNKHVL